MAQLNKGAKMSAEKKIKRHSNIVEVSAGIPKFILDRYDVLAKEYLEKTKNMEFVLNLLNIDKVYDNGFQAIFGTNLNVSKGEFITILGPSGCGKSTTLRVISGLEQTTSGRVKISGVDVTKISPANRNLTMVFQNYALFPHLSVKNNIAFGLKANKKRIGEPGKIYNEIVRLENKVTSFKKTQKDIQNLNKFIINLKNVEKKFAYFKAKNLSKTEKNRVKLITQKTNIELLNKEIAELKNIANNLPILEKEVTKDIANISQLKLKYKNMKQNFDVNKIINEKVNWASEILGLEYYMNRKPGQLSGGQRQRVALGRSIVGNPSLFLMDEPLSNLDAKLRTIMRSEIKKLHVKINTATIYVTHDQIEAMTMADRIVVMSDGFVQQIGSPTEVYNNPSNLFVANFVGTPSINLWEGKIINGFFESDNGLKIKVMQGKLQNTSKNQKVVFGIRPTDFIYDTSILNAYDAKIKVKITESELLGNQILFTGLVINNKGLELDEIKFITDSYQETKIGQIMNLTIIMSRLHLFDKETTLSLTSKYNYETLSSLINWTKSTDKIEARRILMEKEKRKSQKKGIIVRSILKLKNRSENAKSISRE